MYKSVAMDRHARSLIKIYKEASGLRTVSDVIDDLLDGKDGPELTADMIGDEVAGWKSFSIMSVRPDTLERLRAYKKERRLKTYGWAIRSLFNEVGYEKLVKKTLKKMGGTPDAISWE